MKVEYSYLLEQFQIGKSETKVKYVDLSRQANVEGIISEIKEILLKTGQFTLGSPVAEFEVRFAKFCSTEYAVGVNSGTDALFLTMKALNIGQGDEVITAPNSFISTAGAIANTGARPVFVDVDDEYNVDANLIEEAITPKTRAIIPVHLTGNPADMLRIMDIAKRHSLPVIEDACQAVNASINRQSVGSFGIAGCFSFHPLKNLNVWGDSGIIVTNSEELADKLVLLRNHGLKGRDECELFAYNSRLDTLQAIVANRLMDDLDAITNARIKNATTYDDAFSDMTDFIKIPPRKDNVKQVYHTYVVQAEKRDELVEYLASKGIETKVHYPIPIHLQKASEYLGYKEGDFPVCEAQAKSIISLPVHQHLTSEQITYVIDNTRKFYRG
ncbi:DegT/DnrJ/EryC1/StrS family aminotransferase [Chloroflexota bacterium]